MRLIDADALMEAINQTCSLKVVSLGNMVDIIGKQPTVDDVPRWIPCEEMMPEKEKPYHRRDFFLTTNAYGAVNVTTYEFENDFQKRGWQSDICIIAWMPLPEPYKRGEEDERV